MKAKTYSNSFETHRISDSVKNLRDVIGIARVIMITEKGVPL